MDFNSPERADLLPAFISRNTLTGIVWGGFVLGTIALAGRYYTRIKCFKRLLPDDYITGLAWLLLLSAAILFQTFVADMYEISAVGANLRPPSANFATILIKYTRRQLVYQVLYHAQLWSVKISFLVFFYRLGSQVTYYKVAWWIVTVFTICAGCVVIGTLEYSCQEGSVEVLVAKCTGLKAVERQDTSIIVKCALNVGTDAAIMMLPISILWNIRISLRRRLAFTALFSSVLITIAISITRIAVVMGSGSRTTNRASKWTRWEMSWYLLWQFIENSVALIVACIGSFRALFVSKERGRDADEALRRQDEEDAKARTDQNLKMRRAKAKFFQDSLLVTEKSIHTSTTHAEGPLELEDGTGERENASLGRNSLT
ncbi:hypothetical protein CC80DRAFT_482433 [Byssothecium circinans]|uniref:Rhodopsin domain-containing protein n=1 Tax=Byssothecium circinans TaxID=147558 RepID=A0A6A5TE52_9PLEO|nr:hypothetical protein CC80DRAFT_482433 [Byssothecium circinans]